MWHFILLCSPKLIDSTTSCLGIKNKKKKKSEKNVLYTFWIPSSFSSCRVLLNKSSPFWFKPGGVAPPVTPVYPVRRDNDAGSPLHWPGQMAGSSQWPPPLPRSPPLLSACTCTPIVPPSSLFQQCLDCTPTQTLPPQAPPSPC